MSEEKENKKQSEELSREELEKVTGGWGDISSPDKHKDWSEITSFNHNVS
jgi:hypothetical protein